MPERGSTPLELFWKLAEKNDGVRVDAAIKLVSHLQRLKVKESEAEDFEKSLKYCLNRLVTGLASDRAHSRRGFFISLVEFLRVFGDKISVQDVFEVMEETLNDKGTKGEEAEFICGKIFTLGALLRSEKASYDEVGQIFGQLLDLSLKRSYLSASAYKFIIDNLPSLKDEDKFTEAVWPVFEEKLPCKSENDRLEAIWCLLEIDQQFSKLPSKSFMLEKFHRKKLIAPELSTDVSEILMRGNASLSIVSQTPVLKGICSALSKSDGLLEDFWSKKISPNLNKSSTFKTTLAFALMKIIIPLWSDKDNLGSILTPNIVEVSISLLSRLESSNQDDAMILSAFESLVEAIKENPKAQTSVMKTLLKANIAFDKVSGSNVVQRLLSQSTLPTIKAAYDLYKNALSGQKEEGSLYSVRERVYAGQQLTKLVGHPVTSADLEWKSEVINFLLTVTLFELRKPYGPVKTMPLKLSREAKTELKDAFYKALDFKAKSLESVASILMQVMSYASTLLSAGDTVAKPLNPLTGPAAEAWTKMVKTVEGINSIKKEDRVFQLLLVHIGFQLFSDPAAAIELLDDLHVCYDKAKKATAERRKSKRRSAVAKAATLEDNEPHWVEVVVDLLLSLLSQNKSVLRHVVNQVISLLCPHMTKRALQTIMEAINPPQDEAMEQDSDENEEDDDDFEPITDQERAEIQAKMAEAQESESEEGSDSDSESDSEAETDEAEILRKKLKDAMGKDADSDAESIDMDDLDDEAMNKLDEALAKVFRQMSGKKSSAEKRKEKKDLLALVHFKIRALDMIDQYLSHQPAMSSAIFLSMQVIRALESSGKDKEQAPLQTRLKGTLRKLTNSKKLILDNDINSQDILETLKDLLELANSGSPIVAQISQPLPLFSQLAAMILKCSQQVSDEKLHEEIKEIYCDAMDDFFKKSHCQLTMSFFQLPLQGTWKDALSLVDKLTILGFAEKTRMYRRTQAMALINTFLLNQNLRGKMSKKTAEVLVTKIAEAFDAYMASPDTAKVRFLCELLNLTRSLLSMPDSKLLTEKHRELIKAKLEELREKVPKNRHFQDVKKAFNKNAVILQLNVITGNEKKRKNSESKDDDTAVKLNGKGIPELDNADKNGDVKSKKKKKKKVSKETKQKRKERKKFDLEDQYKDIELPSFASALQDPLASLSEPPKKKSKANYQGRRTNFRNLMKKLGYITSGVRAIDRPDPKPEAKLEEIYNFRRGPSHEENY